MSQPSEPQRGPAAERAIVGGGRPSGEPLDRAGGLGIRIFLFLTVSICAVLPLAFFGARQAERAAADQIDEADRQTLASARALASQITVSLDGYARALRAVAAQIEALGGLSGPRVAAAVSAHSENHPEFLGAYVAGIDGVSLLHYAYPGGIRPGGTNYSDRDYFREVLRTDEVAISKVQIGRVAKVAGVQMGAPIHDSSGKLYGLFCNSIDLAPLTASLRQAAEGLGAGRLVVIDGYGQIIADSSTRGPIELRRAPAGGIFAPVGAGSFTLRVGEDEHGEQSRVAVVGMGKPVPTWRVIALKSKEEVERAAVAIRTQTLFVAAFVVLAALVIAALVSTWLSRPVTGLARAAEEVARGDFRRSLPALDTGPREFRMLSRALRSMVETMRAHAENLEGLVGERTLQLQQANLEISQALAKVQNAERKVLSDIQQASEFQRRMLPALTVTAPFDIAACYLPLERVGGDIYDVHELAPGRFRFFVADATGHGVQASLRTILLKATYDRLKTQHRSLNDLLGALNAHLVEEFPDGDLHSAVSCVDVEVAPNGARVSYCLAGGSPLYHFSSSGAREVFRGSPLLGVDPVTWPDAEVFELARGDLLLLCSDGLVEQRNADKEHFERMLPGLRFGEDHSADECLETLMSSFDEFRAECAVMDDVTVVVIKIGRAPNGAPAKPSA